MDPAISHSKQTNLSKLSKEEMCRLQEKCENGDPEAREKIILAHLPLVRKLAKSYCGKGVPYEDLYQEGCYGLIKAVANYKCRFNASFATYSSYYIIKYLKKAIISQTTFSPIVYKEQFYYDLQKYIRTFDSLSEKYSRHPSDSELAKKMNLPEKKIQLLRRSAHMFLYYPSHIQTTEPNHCPKSMMSESAEDFYFEQNHILDLNDLGVLLTRREREVLCRKLGFTKTGTAESYAQISAAMGLSFETIRTTYLMALKKIRDAIEEKGLDVSTFET